MLLSEVAAFLAAPPYSIAGIRLGFLPASPDVVTVLYEYGGAPPEGGFGVVGIKYEMPGLQAVCRGAANDYAGPRARIETIYRALATIEAQTLSGTEYLTMRAQQSPFLLLRDDLGRVSMAVNFLAEKALSVA